MKWLTAKKFEFHCGLDMRVNLLGVAIRRDGQCAMCAAEARADHEWYRKHGKLLLLPSTHPDDMYVNNVTVYVGFGFGAIMLEFVPDVRFERRVAVLQAQLLKEGVSISGR